MSLRWIRLGNASSAASARPYPALRLSPKKRIVRGGAPAAGGGSWPKRDAKGSWSNKPATPRGCTRRRQARNAAGKCVETTSGNIGQEAGFVPLAGDSKNRCGSALPAGSGICDRPKYRACFGDTGPAGSRMEMASDVNRSSSRLTKTYRSGERDLTVLREVSFFPEHPGATMRHRRPLRQRQDDPALGLCAGLDRATSGSVRLAGTALETLDEDARARLRNEHTGSFVFQNFAARADADRPGKCHGARRTARRLRYEIGVARRPAAALIGGRERTAAAGRVARGNTAHGTTRPAGFPDGEQQRVALARAFINRPRLALSPTSRPDVHLDAETSERVVELLRSTSTPHPGRRSCWLRITSNSRPAPGASSRLRDGAMVENPV